MAQRRDETMRPIIPIFLAIAACLADTGCVSAKSVHYYTLGASAPPANRGKPDGLILAARH